MSIKLGDKFAINNNTYQVVGVEDDNLFVLSMINEDGSLDNECMVKTYEEIEVA